MCRLFGFRSVIPSQVHRSIAEAENAILHQSNFHSDGWGISYYVAGSPHVIKSTSKACDDQLFHKVSGILASETVVAHIRKATQGEVCVTNVHPFQYGRWIFAHNGNIANFQHFREKLISIISPKLARYILGETDSEVLFYLLLTSLSKQIDLHRIGCPLPALIHATRETVDAVTQVVGPFHPEEDGPPEQTYLTFILTDGASMLAHQGGKSLYYSTYKSQCSERLSCPSYESVCENPSPTGYVNHLLFSSEPILGENLWLKMAPSQIVAVDWSMRYQSIAPTTSRV